MEAGFSRQRDGVGGVPQPNATQASMAYRRTKATLLGALVTTNPEASAAARSPGRSGSLTATVYHATSGRNYTRS